MSRGKNPAFYYRESPKWPSSFVQPRTNHIALIGNFLPRQCGIATYTTDTYAALTDRFSDLQVDVYAMNDRAAGLRLSVRGDRHDRSRTIAWPISPPRATSRRAARRRYGSSTNTAFSAAPRASISWRCSIALSLPVIVTLHTVLDQPNDDQRRVMDGLLKRAAKVVVMAEIGREILVRVYGANPKAIMMIPHGVPDRALVDPDSMKARFGWEGRKVLLTFGLLAPNKGIESVISAMPAVVAANPDALYVVLGATHPNLVAHEGEAYRDRLKALAADRGVADHVRFIDGFIEHDELLDYLQAADLYVTPYTNPQQITSGTLSYAVGVGKAVVSTPYIHATEILADGHGVLVDFGDVDGFAREISRLLYDDGDRAEVSARAYARGRTMIWPRLAEASMAAIDAIVAARPRRIKSAAPLPALAPNIAAVERMSDATGMFQHAILSVPDRRHGYCIDDNVRALMLMSAIDDLDEELRDKWMTVYAAFVQYAWNPDTRRFRNFMNFDRTWCEDQGSEDSNGRTIWALGVTAKRARSRQASRLGAALVRRDREHRVRPDQPARAGVRDARRRRDAGRASRVISWRAISSNASRPICSRCSTMRGGPNGNGSRSCWRTTMRGCPRR